MSKRQKVKSLLIGITMILVGLFILIEGEEAIPLIIVFYALTMFFRGLGLISYYFSMARHMVGGRIVLGKALALIDIALFTVFVIYIPTGFIILYLVVIYLFAGIVDMLGALDARKLEASRWKERFFSGLFNTAISIICIFSFHSPAIMVTVYVIGIFSSGLIRIANCFRKTASAYIA